MQACEVGAVVKWMLALFPSHPTPATTHPTPTPPYSSVDRGVYTAMSSQSIAVGRLSFVLGLHGACIAFATACSASLTSAHACVKELQLNGCDTGLNAGISLMLHPFLGTVLAAAGMTSQTGRCLTFDTRADGYGRGDACVCTVLQPEGKGGIFVDGTAARQDGRSASLTAPNGSSQQGLLTAALADAGRAPGELVFNEAHGTGTALGDPIEMGSLMAAVLAKRKGTLSQLSVGSVKSNIGHTESGAGAVGFLKLVFGLRHALATPNAQLRALNPHVARVLRAAPCSLPAQLAAMEAGTRAGGVSSFGYSGSIAHVLLSHIGVDGGRVPWSVPHAYRRHAFLWRKEAVSTAETARTSMYAVSWESTPVAQEVSAGLVLLLAPNSSATCTAEASAVQSGASPRWQAVAVLLTGKVSVAPSLQGAYLTASLAQQLVGQAQAPRMVVFTYGALASNAAHSGAWGLMRVLRREQPGKLVVGVDVTHCAVGATIATAFAATWTETEVALRGSDRHCPKLRMCVSRSGTALARGLYTIFGGLGGLGLQAAKLLIESGAAGVVLSSRSGRVGCRDQGLTGKLASLGGMATVTVSDVGDALEMATLAVSAVVTGVLHASGVLRDTIALSIVTEDLDVVFSPKAVAASHAHAAMARAPLEALGMFSSVASAFGNASQANYAAANAYLDSLALSRRLRGAAGSSLQVRDCLFWQHGQTYPLLLKLQPCAYNLQITADLQLLQAHAYHYLPTARPYLPLATYCRSLPSAEPG